MQRIELEKHRTVGMLTLYNRRTELIRQLKSKQEELNGLGASMEDMVRLYAADLGLDPKNSMVRQGEDEAIYIEMLEPGDEGYKPEESEKSVEAKKPRAKPQRRKQTKSVVTEGETTPVVEPEQAKDPQIEKE